MDAFHDEFAKPLRYCLRLFSKNNIFIFDDNVSFYDKYVVFTFKMTCILCYVIYLFGYLILTENMSFVEFVDVIPVATVAAQAILKGFLLITEKDNIREVITELGCMWKSTYLSDIQSSKRNNMQNWLSRFINVLYWVTIIACYQFILTALQQTLFKRFILKQEAPMLMPSPGYLPFDYTHSWIIYILTYAFLTYSMIHLVYIFFGADILLDVLCGHLTTQFILLQEDFLNVKPFLKSEIEIPSQITIKNVTRKHQKLILISQKLDEIFNRILFVNLMGATISICFFGFTVKIVRGPLDVIKGVLAVSVIILPVFYYCYFGELLAQSSLQLADKAYESEWYICGEKHKKAILFIIKRSQRPSYITSLGISPITLGTFTMVMSRTWSYFSLASNVYEDRNE